MKRYAFPLSRTCYRDVIRPLRRAVDPRRGYPLPALPRLSQKRLRSLLGKMEAGRSNQRAVWLSLTEDDASTLHAWLGWMKREGKVMPGSALSARERAAYVCGLD